MRHTGDSGGDADSIYLSTWRGDGAKSKSAVLSMPCHSSQTQRENKKDRETGSEDAIRVDKSYKVRIERSDSQQELNHWVGSTHLR